MPDTYLKKVPVTDEQSTPQARADRLRRLRHLANLSRKDMCNHRLNFNTLKAWELARFGGLPKDGADKVIERVAKEGINCTREWLLYGKGAGPQLDSERELIKQLEKIRHDMQTPLATIHMGITTSLESLCHDVGKNLSPLNLLLANSLEGVNQLQDLLNQFSSLLKERKHEQ